VGGAKDFCLRFHSEGGGKKLSFWDKEKAIKQQTKTLKGIIPQYKEVGQ